MLLSDKGGIKQVLSIWDRSTA